MPESWLYGSPEPTLARIIARFSTIPFRFPISMSNLSQEVAKRRTFAIISHPDAGKTTITEKVLLFGQALQKAGTVKGKKSGQHAKSEIGRASCRERV